MFGSRQLFNKPPFFGNGRAQPVMAFDFTQSAGLVAGRGGQTITFTRASSGTRFNSAGTLVTETTDVARFDYNPATLAPLGLLVEDARTNVCLQSNAFTTTWSALGTPAATQNVVSPDGGTTAWTMTDNNAAATEGVSQAITLTAAAYTLSIYIKKTSGATVYPVLEAITGTVTANCTVDTNNGIATIWTAYTGRTMLASASATCTNAGSFWRVTMTYTATAAAYTHSIFAAATATATQATGAVDVAQQGSNVFYGAQVELGTFASSYIATTTVGVTRAIDSAKITTITPWFNTLEGTLVAEYDVNSDSTTSLFPGAFSFSDGTTSNYMSLFSRTSDDTNRSTVVVATVSQAEMTITNITYSSPVKSALAYKLNDFAYCAGGSTVQTDVVGTIPTVSEAAIGSLAGGVSLVLNGHVKKASYYNRRLSNTQIQSLTV